MDFGAHSATCANADGGDCYCECNGSQHGIVHMSGPPRGRHDPGKILIEARRGPHGVYYRVTDWKGVPPGGGTKEDRLTGTAAKVDVKVRTPTGTHKVGNREIPPHVATRISEVRGKLPKDLDGWREAAAPSGDADGSDVSFWRNRSDKVSEQLVTARQQRDQWVEMIQANMRNQGMPDVRVTRLTTPMQLRQQYPDYRKFEERIAYLERELTDAVGKAARSQQSDRRVRKWKSDPSSRQKVPGAELERHLDDVLDVGRQAYAAIQREFEHDPKLKEWRDLLARGGFISQDQIRKRESAIIREMLGKARDFGGVTHTDVRGTDAARADWRQRLKTAEHFFPDDWLRRSAEHHLSLGSASRAYYSAEYDVLAMPNVDRFYNGAFADSVGEITVHELGHRMEHRVPGLTALEFAFVRRRSTKPDGRVEFALPLAKLSPNGGYSADEVAFSDDWKNKYAGKTYEAGDRDNPDTSYWEVFQVGLQDVYGRSSTQFGDDELQAFVIGTLLTLA